MSKNKNNWNGEFVQEYNILDSLCKRLSPRGDKTRSGIHNLEEALRKSNYKKAEELGYLRKYKNTTVSHRASKEMPSTPQEYVVFIRNLRCEVENNRGKYKTLLPRLNKRKPNDMRVDKMEIIKCKVRPNQIVIVTNKGQLKARAYRR